ncbi:MAG TPA: hypothetical protein VGL06_29485 [Pseudonocardiaceae bacterium]
MTLPARMGPKGFAGAIYQSRIANSPERLLDVIATTMVTTQTTSGLLPGISAEWEPWRIGPLQRTQREYNDEKTGIPTMLDGATFWSETRFIEREGDYVRRGGVVAECFASFDHPSFATGFSLVRLDFSDTKPSPMWLYYTSELIVYHTTVSIAAQILQYSAVPGMALLMEDGGWLNRVFLQFGTEF